MKDIDLAIVMGSDSDYPELEDGIALLKKFGIAHEVRILSAHRTPRQLSEYISGLKKRGAKAIIAAAGGAAHLPGVIASLTTIPVIGVPMTSKLMNGLDSLLSIVQMPSGIPVATMAVGKAGAKNGAIFALHIMALSDKGLEKKLADYRQEMEESVLEKDRKLSGR